MYATRIAVFTIATTPLTVEGGNPIFVHSITVANDSASNIAQSFTWTTGGTTTVLPVIAVLARDTVIWQGTNAQCQALALTAAPASGVTVTILYRVDG